MGVYLSSPVTEKISEDKSCAKFKYGVSSMQGWRMSQEDAHNCISDFDNNTALFAVYDGHGGAEVAQYTAAHLPDFIKNLSLYKEGKLTEALQEAFLGFDKTLTEEVVIQQLKALAGVDDDDNDEHEDEEGMGRSERDILVAEANMPIEELMSKYTPGASPAPVPQLQKLQKEKNQSPMIKAKKASVTARAGGSGDTNNSASDPLDEKLENGQPDNDNNLNAEKELLQAESQVGSKTDNDEPDSTGDLKSENNSNNSVNTVFSNGENKHLDTQGDNEVLDNKNGVKNNISEADSTSDKSDSVSKSEKVSVLEIKSEGATITSETAVTSGSSTSSEGQSSSGAGSSDSSGVSSAGSSSSGAGSSSSSAVSSAGSSSSGASSSGVSSVASSSSESSNSGSSGGPSGSGIQAGGSGIGSSKKPSAKVVDDDDSDDDSTDDEEYMEDSEDDDDDDDDDDDEEDSEQGGIFGVRGVGVAEEEDHVEEPGTDSGCTAVVAMIRDDKIYVANAGDSRCVLCQAGKAVDLSFDHKPEDDCERTRIEAAGGKVTNDGRVNGGLNLSRALGDHWYKRNETKEPQDQMISALPDIECATITPDDDFLVIACDGIWNFMTSQETVDFIQERLKDPAKYDKPSLICEEMFDHCLAPNTMGDGTGCDNMTCIIVVFNKPQNSCKRDNKNLDVSVSDDKQPEKRARVEEEMATCSDT